jgi:heme A synthase
MAGHLLNTFLLMAALSLTAWWASGGTPLRLRGQGAGQSTIVWLLGAALAGLLVLGMSGAITALGDTLVLGGGISPDESPIVAGLVGMRIYHPLIAFVVGALVAAAAWLVRVRRPGLATRRISTFILVVYALQLLLGALNVALKAPVWIQMLHLLLSNFIWVGVVLLAAAALGSAAQEAAAAPAPRPVSQAGGAAPRAS